MFIVIHTEVPLNDHNNDRISQMNKFLPRLE